MERGQGLLAGLIKFAAKEEELPDSHFTVVVGKPDLSWTVEKVWDFLTEKCHPDHGIALLFIPIDSFPTHKEMALRHGWTPYRSPIVWIKRLAGVASLHPAFPSPCTEFLIYAVRNPDVHRLPSRLTADWITHVKEDSALMPPLLVRDLLRLYTTPERTVFLDPWADQTFGSCLAGAVLFGAQEVWGMADTPGKAERIRQRLKEVLP